MSYNTRLFLQPRAWVNAMPIYEYRCESCGNEIEKIQKISEPALTDCPECGKPALKKMVSASSFRLKGSGWYETDFKNKKKPGAKDAEGKSADSSKDSAAGGNSKSKKSDSGASGSGESKKTGND